MAPVRIEQTLHGYDRGHRLLASSTRIPDEASEQMLVLSDLAGTRQEKGFDDYLTGYPLKSIGYYALARTWLAPEMPRPGCVWTHTLLIPFASIANVDGQELLRSHRRPLGSVDGRRYEVSVTSRSKGGVRPEIDFRLASAFVQALYLYPHLAAWISSHDSHAFEELALALWNQQWPELRREFGFSSGSLSPRRIDGRLLDLQIVPESQSPSWFELRGVKDIASLRTQVSWARRAASDLPQGGMFEAFLRAVGTGGRSNFAEYARLFVLAENARRHGNVDGVLAAGRSLKVPAADRNAVWTFLLSPEFRLGDAQAIELALRANGGKTIPQAGLSTRVERLASGHPRRLWNLLRGLSHVSASSPVGRQLLAATLKEFSTGELLSHLDADTPAMLEMIRIRPDIAANPRIWTGAAKAQEEIIDSLASYDIPDGKMAAILGSIVAARSAEALNSAARRWPAMMSIAVLDALQNGHQPPQISVKAKQLLTGNTAAVLAWLRAHSRPSEQVLTFLAQSADTHEVFEVTPLSRWAEFATQGGLDGAGPYAISSLLRRGFSASGADAMWLTARAYWLLDERLRIGGFPDRAWSVVEPVLPTTGFLRQRGRSTRLREAVVGHWVENAFPLHVLLAAGGLTDLPQNLRKTIGNVRGGKSYLRAISAADG